jgi:hypothetical protein
VFEAHGDAHERRHDLVVARAGRERSPEILFGANVISDGGKRAAAFRENTGVAILWEALRGGNLRGSCATANGEKKQD